ncbi:alpha/beta hydrolase fold-3 domain-containing protein [Verticillium dahliae VdLs.17]|uniref:Alpha/beta hydrolase fold-3 domain-containing protein n=1 Tax=Verticillium dahliae (strain VdLs.17 / ATCC MYA-4575 / FGSC 10137) TaxID=498257 RepID=G2XHQ0_VERDV|nr:alpha/beta hydrolase fold-3 domain-containing protein [Verticillium dahliae VdLs.17]EGY19344.1 alpha/beta hydrolase fold-3 domain-containing protein [Verticillium dahliae VdLs.17]
MAQPPSKTYPFPYSQAAQLDDRIKGPRPIIDPTLTSLVDLFLLPEELDLDLMRGTTVSSEENEATPFVYNADTVVQSAPHLEHVEHHLPGPDGNDVILSIFKPKQPTSSNLPVVYHIHGGGMVAGDRFSAVTELLGLLKDVECAFASVEYRLAPETRAPGPAEDCHAGLVWLSQHATSLGLDAAGIVVLGVSGGAALAAVICLMARDRKSLATPVKAQMLLSPMLDDRCASVSDQQFEYGSPWSGVSNRMAWTHALGDDRATDRVTPYQAPSRAVDLANLPPTYIDAAECEVFRDPAVLYAMNMWRCGSTFAKQTWLGRIMRAVDLDQ